MAGASRLVALRFVLSASHRLMGVFGSIVLSEPLLMPSAKKTDLFLRERPTFESRLL
jgi:hypothetical protein